jgi:pilus assembly protein Flp/PilA
MELNVEGPAMSARTSGRDMVASAALRDARSGICAFLRERKGVTAIEYGLVSALVAVVIIVAINTLGQTALTQLFQKVANSL